MWLPLFLFACFSAEWASFANRRNENRVIDLRDGAKVSLETGKKFMQAFKESKNDKSIFSFFPFMDEREKNFVLARRNPIMALPPQVGPPILMGPQGEMISGIPFEEIRLVKDPSQGTFPFDYRQDQMRSRPYQVDYRYESRRGNNQRRGGPRGGQYTRRPFDGDNRGGYRRGGPRFEKKEEPERNELNQFEPKEITKQADKKKKNVQKRGEENEQKPGPKA